MKARAWCIYYRAHYTKVNTTFFLGFERTELVGVTETLQCAYSQENPFEMDLTVAIELCKDHFSSIKTREEKQLIRSGSATINPYDWHPIGI